MRYAFENVAPERSRLMSAIRKRGNRSTELAFRLYLVRAGLRGWEMHASDIPGCPDFLFPEKRIAVFVDGCFWHGCPKHATKPANNRAFWKKKLAGNKTRDRLVNRTLRRAGWRVIRIWECNLAKHPEASIRQIQRELNCP